MVKKIILGIIIFIAIICFISKCFYPKTMIVTDVNEETDVVTIRDFNGFIWEFSGIEDWVVGDFCSVIMFDSFTRNITDDIIVTTEYLGFINENGNFADEHILYLK